MKKPPSGMPGGGFFFRHASGGWHLSSRPQMPASAGMTAYFTYMLCFGRAMTRITIGSKNSSGSL